LLKVGRDSEPVASWGDRDPHIQIMANAAWTVNPFDVMVCRRVIVPRRMSKTVPLGHSAGGNPGTKEGDHLR
jgi:hypothetical protein